MMIVIYKATKENLTGVYMVAEDLNNTILRFLHKKTKARKMPDYKIHIIQSVN